MALFRKGLTCSQRRFYTISSVRKRRAGKVNPSHRVKVKLHEQIVAKLLVRCAAAEKIDRILVNRRRCSPNKRAIRPFGIARCTHKRPLFCFQVESQHVLAADEKVCVSLVHEHVEDAIQMTGYDGGPG